jgi:hypothetical protein
MRTIPIKTLKDNLTDIFGLYLQLYGKKYTANVFGHAEWDEPDETEYEDETEEDKSERMEKNL